MNHRVAPLLGLAVVLHDAAHVCGGEEPHDIVDGPLDFVLDVGIEVVEEFAQERIGLRNETRRLFAGEILRRVVVEAGGEHPVCESLRIDVRELVRVCVGHEYALEALHQFPERRAFGVAARKELLRGDLKKPRLRRHELRKLGRGGDGLRLGVAEAFDERDESAEVLGERADAVASLFSDAHGVDECAVLVEVKVEEVREGNRLIRRLVAVELLLVAGVLLAREVARANFLRFDNRNEKPAVRIGCDCVVGLVALHRLRLVRDAAIGEQRPQKWRQRVAVGDFRAVAFPVDVIHGVDVRRDRRFLSCRGSGLLNCLFRLHNKGLSSCADPRP